jgi:hypothetical protein
VLAASLRAPDEIENKDDQENDYQDPDKPVAGSRERKHLVTLRLVGAVQCLTRGFCPTSRNRKLDLPLTARRVNQARAVARLFFPLTNRRPPRQHDPCETFTVRADDVTYEYLARGYRRSCDIPERWPTPAEPRLRVLRTATAGQPDAVGHAAERHAVMRFRVREVAVLSNLGPAGSPESVEGRSRERCQLPDAVSVLAGEFGASRLVGELRSPYLRPPRRRRPWPASPASVDGCQPRPRSRPKRDEPPPRPASGGQPHRLDLDAV